MCHKIAHMSSALQHRNLNHMLIPRTACCQLMRWDTMKARPSGGTCGLQAGLMFTWGESCGPLQLNPVATPVCAIHQFWFRDSRQTYTSHRSVQQPHNSVVIVSTCSSSVTQGVESKSDTDMNIISKIRKGLKRGKLASG